MKQITKILSFVPESKFFIETGLLSVLYKQINIANETNADTGKRVYVVTYEQQVGVVADDIVILSDDLKNYKISKKEVFNALYSVELDYIKISNTEVSQISKDGILKAELGGVRMITHEFTNYYIDSPLADGHYSHKIMSQGHFDECVRAINSYNRDVDSKQSIKKELNSLLKLI